jgi:hypothetical protein
MDGRDLRSTTATVILDETHLDLPPSPTDLNNLITAPKRSMLFGIKFKKPFDINLSDANALDPLEG